MNPYIISHSESLEIKAENCGKTVKELLYGNFALSTNAVKSLKYKGRILLDGEEVTVGEKVSKGQILTLEFAQITSESIVPVELPLEILYEDEHLLAVNKPMNMPTHPSHGHRTDTLANAVMHKYAGNFVFRPITRLDIDTTGVVLIAKNAVVCHKMCKSLSSNSGKQEIIKTYMALCVGAPPDHSGIIDAPIARKPGSVLERCVNPEGQRAITKYEVISKSCGTSVVKAIPITGRTHQIRVHMAHIGCSLMGDYLYGKEIPGIRTMLHCMSLEFCHPVSGIPLCIKAPIPEDMSNKIISDKAFF